MKNSLYERNMSDDDDVQTLGGKSQTFCKRTESLKRLKSKTSHLNQSNHVY